MNSGLSHIDFSAKNRYTDTISKEMKEWGGSGLKIKRIAHRGFSSEAPENSRAAFALAVEGDFYGVECDVWKTKDGVYVVSHDGCLERMCGVERNIPEMTCREVMKYPFVKGKKRTMFPDQYVIPLTEYLSLLGRSETKHPVIELKMDYTVAELEEIVQLVKRYGLYERTFFISLYGAVLIRLKEELGFPAERLQYVYGAIRANKYIPVNLEVEHFLIENRLNLDTRYTLLSRGSVMRLHEAGLEVNVWTVNRKKDMEYVIRELGVDMVTTEYYHELDEAADVGVKR